MSEAQKVIRFSWRREWPLMILLLGTIAYGFYVYPTLPDKVPSHWNVYGEVDSWGSPFWGAFGIPLLNLGAYLMLLLTPYIDPKKEKYLQFARPYTVFRYVFHFFLTGLYAIIIVAAAGRAVPVDQLVPIGISILFIVIGNYMGKIRQNYFFGVRTPWTLASDEVWQKTHRFAGPLWVSAGIICLISSTFGGLTSFIIFFSMIAVMVIVPIVYSYLLYKKLDEK